MSSSAWWKNAFKLNTIDGPVLPGDEDEVMGDEITTEEETADETTADEETASEVYANEDEDMDDGDLFGDFDVSGSENDDPQDQPIPTEGRFEVMRGSGGERLYFNVTDARRDQMVADGEYEEIFNQDGTSVRIEKGTTPSL